MRRFILPLVLFAAFGSPARAACESISEREKPYIVCAFPADADSVRLFWKDDAGKPYGSLGKLADTLKSGGGRLLFAMNAGMYEEDLSPVGLYIENGRQLRAANVRSGSGNFHLKPNGVFYIGSGGAGVLETSRYLAEKPAATFATQSGPMLVIGGRIHPKIRSTGTSEKIRNGVGVSGNRIVFAISREPVTFHAFASLFRDRLKTPDALFLDGSISALYAQPDLRAGGLWPVGPIIGVVEKPRAAR